MGSVNLTIIGDTAEEVLAAARRVAGEIAANTPDTAALPAAPDLSQILAAANLGDVVDALRGILPEGMDVEITEKTKAAPTEKPRSKATTKSKAAAKKEKDEKPEDEVDPEAVKRSATEKLFEIFKSGPEGEEAIADVLKTFGVAKFSELDASRAAEMQKAADELAAKFLQDA